MKILLYSDVHFSAYSSIVRSRGKKYSTRLENLIKSITWAEQQAEINSCSAIICLGDFFDKEELSSEELTALRDIEWSNLPHYFLVGNHESGVDGLYYNSTKALEKENFEIISKPDFSIMDAQSDCQLHFLPYILEENRKPLSSYLNLEKNLAKNHIIFSHNDIRGLQYGKFTSKEGFDIEEIKENCDLFFNGHLHNHESFSSKGINLGNLTGQNFSEDSFKYPHYICILDTNNLSTKFIENPYAFNFYKIEIDEEKDLSKLSKLKSNSILSIKCNRNHIDTLKNLISNNKDILEYRVILFDDKNLGELKSQSDSISLNKVDHLSQFYDFVIEKLGNSKVVEEELDAIVRG